MTEKLEKFADLFGYATPINRPEQCPDFGRKPKVRRRRVISSQDARLPFYEPCTRINLASIPEARFQQLCHRRLPIAREIDLHGWFVDEGIRFLQDALEERENYRPECWQIVHGKGRHSPHYDRAPLKQATLNLLLHHSAVNALAEVQDQDGQSGSVLIEVCRRPKY